METGFILFYGNMRDYAFCTVQPLGIPLAPLGHPVIDDAFTKVPVEATPLTQ